MRATGCHAMHRSGQAAQPFFVSSGGRVKIKFELTCASERALCFGRTRSLSIASYCVNARSRVASLQRVGACETSHP